MRSKILTFITVLGFFAISAQANDVDLKKSKLTWVGAKVIGSTHTGHIDIKDAKLNYKKGEPVSGKITIDMNSITNTDLTDKGYNAKLVGHLKSDDFFGVAKHKTAEINIDKIEKASNKFYLLKGKLTIKGKSQPVSLKAEVKQETKAFQVVETDLSFDRTKFGIRYGSGTFFSNLGDKMISDDVKVNVKLHINKKKALAAK